MLFKIKSLKRVMPLKTVKKKTLYDHGYKSVYMLLCALFYNDHQSPRPGKYLTDIETQTQFKYTFMSLNA